jgi:site-specific recombinase XerD
VKRKVRSKRSKTPWNKGKQVGQKLPLSLQQIRSIRVRLTRAQQVRELALFNLAIDSSLKPLDLIRLRVVDVSRGQRILAQLSITAPASKRRSAFVLSPETRASVTAWIKHRELSASDYLFPSRLHASPYLSARQYARLVESWVSSIGLNPRDYGTHSLRRTKPALIYRKTKDLAAVQVLLGNTKLESTERYLGSLRNKAFTPMGRRRRRSS